MFDVAVGFALGVGGTLLAGVALRVLARTTATPAPASAPVPEVQTSQTPQERMEAMLKQAPALFEQARTFERARLAVACVVCGEPTAIVCGDCDQRVCVAHRHPAHTCVK